MKVYLIILFILTVVTSVNANIDDYLQRHQNVRATQSQHDRISQYDHLIEYFCTLPYSPNSIEIHPDFIRALILAESNGNTQAVSSKEARGLTQIMYSTGKEAAQEIITNSDIDFDMLDYVHRSQLEHLTPRDLHDPAVNILIACYLISKYNHDYQGQLDLVVSAWNAGAGSIRHNQPPDYQETLNLIGKVNGLFRFFIQNKS